MKINTAPAGPILALRAAAMAITLSADIAPEPAHASGTVGHVRAEPDPHEDT